MTAITARLTASKLMLECVYRITIGHSPEPTSVTRFGLGARKSIPIVHHASSHQPLALLSGSSKVLLFVIAIRSFD
ncbi:hypothetical protein DQ398_001674 [Rossellomorea marisflavi]|nr:hypothetical protein DQ398_001674 [Rossellomorea marisflavi]